MNEKSSISWPLYNAWIYFNRNLLFNYLSSKLSIFLIVNSPTNLLFQSVSTSTLLFGDAKLHFVLEK